MIEGAEFVVSAAEAGQRVDRIVAGHFPAVARARIVDAIANGDVMVNDQPATKGAKFRAGDRVHVRRLLELADYHARPNPALPLAVLHEDGHVLVLDKPAGMPVHPLADDETDTLVNALLAHDPTLATIGDDPLFPALVHRLDTDTSGVMVAARTPAAYALLRDEFQRHRVAKDYAALVHGAPPDTGRLEHFLAHDPNRRGRMLVFESRPVRAALRPMRACTSYTVRQRFPGYTRLDVRIETGVTHQIRAQLAYSGHAIVGDQLYGEARADLALGLERHFLHAAAIAFTHPGSGQRVRFAAPLPPDLQGALAAISRR